MEKLRILEFLFLFYIFHKFANLDAASINPFQKTNDVCETIACKSAAFTIKESMDPNVSPCDNFYKFACGNYLKKAKIPKGNSHVDRYVALEIEVEKQVKECIEEPIKFNEPRWIRLTKNFYQACMNTSAIEKNSLRTELGKLKKAGGWPVLERKWDEESFNWKRSTYALQEMGYYAWYFFDFKVSIDASNSAKRVLTIDQPPFSVDRETLLKGYEDPIVYDYYKFMVDIAVIFGANRTIAKTEMKRTLEFEITLANISTSTQERAHEVNNSKKMKVWELDSEYPSIPWLAYFNAFLKPIMVINDEEVIQVNAPNFFDKFVDLMNRTPKRVLANFLFWKAAENNLNYLTEDIKNRKMRFEAVLGGQSKRVERSQECLELSDVLGLSAGALYVRKYFNPESKKRAQKLALHIELEFKNILKEAEWMDEQRTASALAKLNSMRMFIGYPPEIFDDKYLDDYYRLLEITPQNYVEAVANLTIFSTDHSFKTLRKPVNDSDWTLHLDTIRENSGAVYSQKENSLDYPAGLLRGIFFDTKRPQYLNYAGIAAFDLGHEITRAFDNDGRQFDKNGNSNDWWTPRSNKQFIQKAACFIEQYGYYMATEVNLKVNGIKTQESNIADNGGVKVAYQAYQSFVRQRGTEPKLPGLSYSGTQLFWIQAAITQCTKFTHEFLENSILSSNNSPPEFRVIGAFANRPEFSRDFNCPKGSIMNPVDKCYLW
ncbi:neprilysin-2-like [Belonocnema kinseyi]|uniref:neprilysin-2-like n=1 Tax=Belonocnema kinseyi TaxID=2817044 RepID=UPI00143E0A54|nr:neprilysin-2-like [Belonocnema kinseyi]